MTHDELVSHVAEHAGLSGPEAAERAVCVVLGGVCEQLSWQGIQALAEDLPAPLGARVRQWAPGRPMTVAELHARVAREENVRLGMAVELTEVVCQGVAEALTAGTLHRLREALPEPMGALFTPRERGERFEPVHLDPSRHTLAEGRPGSRHPLSEAQPERAHAQSVVRADNPHGDTKLSSAAGLTQEREQETLATGHPRAR